MPDLDIYWNKVISDFRRVCLLKRQGKLDASDSILNGDLTQSIAAWSQQIKQDSPAKRQTLHEMFITEERRVEEAWQIQKIVLEEIHERLTQEVQDQVREQVRNQVMLSLQDHVDQVRNQVVGQIQGQVDAALRGALASQVVETRTQEPALQPSPSWVESLPRIHLQQESLSFDLPETPPSDSVSVSCEAILSQDSQPEPEFTEPAAEPLTIQAMRSVRGPRADDLSAVLDYILTDQAERDLRDEELAAA